MSQSGHGSVPARVLRQRATLPDISWPYVYAQTVGVSADRANMATAQCALIFAMGRALFSTSYPKPCLARVNASIVVCASKDKLVVADFDGHPQVEFVRRNRDAVFQWPEVGDGFVVWSDLEGPIITVEGFVGRVPRSHAVPRNHRLSGIYCLVAWAPDQHAAATVQWWAQGAHVVVNEPSPLAI